MGFFYAHTLIDCTFAIVKHIILILLTSISFVSLRAQESPERYDSRFDSIQKTTVDSLYLEDQFYVGFGFNLLLDKPEGFSQNGFSGGLHLGYIRDIPINKRRNFGFGVGVGWSINTYNQNLFIGEKETEQTIFNVVDRGDLDVNTNRFSTYLIEAPLELRWRTSTATDYKFWRIYAGVRLGYIYHFKSKFEQPNNAVNQTQLDELNRFRVAGTFTFGYNVFNFSFYYSLNPLFDGTLEDENTPVNLVPLKIGLMFYIL